jgi:hypothetical protein
MKFDEAGWQEQLRRASILGKATLQSAACWGQGIPWLMSTVQWHF